MIPVMILWCVTGPVLKAFGKDEDISNAAWKYALIIVKNICAYFCAMRALDPSVKSSFIGITVNLLLGLPLVVGWPFSLKEDGF